MIKEVNMDCTYQSLLKGSSNFQEKYKINNIKEFKPICKLMDSLGVTQNKKRDFFEKYYVPDLISEDCEVLFVVESPHKDEIIHKHSLAGYSGLNLSKGLVKA